MRNPQTWYDKSLLEDEPFFSSFKVHQIAGRQCIGKKDHAPRFDTIVKEIEDKDLSKVVQSWLDLAFEPHRNDKMRKMRRVEAGEPGMLHFFVRFYWALYQMRGLATLTLQKERRRRGFQYALPQYGASSASVAGKRIPQNAIDEKTKAYPLQCEVKVNHISDGALHGQPLPKTVKTIPASLKFNKIKKDVPGRPEREEISSQSCPPSLDPTSELSETQNPFQTELNFSTLPFTPDPQNTTAVWDLHKTRKRRQTTPDTRCVKHRQINGDILDTSKFYDVIHPSVTQLADTSTTPNNQVTNFGVGDNLYPRSQSLSPFEWKMDTFSPSCPPLNDPQGGEDGMASNPMGRCANNSEDRQHKRQEVTTDQDPAVQPDRVKKRRGRPPKAKGLGQEGSVSVAKKLAPRKEKKGRTPKSNVVSPAQAQLDAEMAVPLFGKSVGFNQESSISTYVPFPPAQHHDIFCPGETVEELLWHDRIPLLTLDRSMEEELINSSKRWWSAQEHDLVDEAFTCVTPTDIFPTQKPPLNVGPPIWAQVQEHGLVDEAFTCVTPAAMEDNSTDIFPTQKLPLNVRPPIWAQSRQEICETFDWFRSYQGGVYFAQNMVKGYLLSAFSSKCVYIHVVIHFESRVLGQVHRRDRFEHGGRLIISHGGGKAESLYTRKGQTMTQPASDQLAQDKSVRALLDNYRNQRPLVLLIDDKYVLFPYDLGARDMTYVVLGFYTIAHAWAEYQPASNEAGRVVRYKFAFRWCDDQGSPWWLSDKDTHLSNLTPSTPTTFSFEPASKPTTPAKKSKIGQDAFLSTTNVIEAASSEPKSFVCTSCHMRSTQVYTWWACLHPNCSKFWRDTKGGFLPHNIEYDSSFLKLITSPPVSRDLGQLKPNLPSRLSTDGTVTNYAFTRGFHCDSCGRLSCRSKWERWECMSCGLCLEASKSTHEAKDFWSNFLPIGYKDHLISKISNIEPQPVRAFKHENGMGNIQSFILPDGRGKIHHIQPGTPLGRLEADKIFVEYQRQGTIGELKFRRWPLRSHKCRGALLSNYFSQNSGHPYQYVGGAANTVPFENAPSAVVNARALIQKRIRQALEMHVEFNEVLSAAYMDKQKMAFHSDNEIGLGAVVAGLSLGSPALMHFRIHVKHDPLREQKGNLLSFVLRHGDVLVMDGASVQEYYEHTVIPNNFRIAATARQINPGHFV